MLGLLRKAKKKPKPTPIDASIAAAAARRQERLGLDVSPSLARLKADARTIARHRNAQKREFQRRRRRRLAVRAVEGTQFKTWVRHRNPNLNRTMDRRKERSRVLREWFGFLDDDGSGEISRAELGGPLISLGLARNMREVDKLIASVDQDGSGDIDFAEFEAMLAGGKAGPIGTLLKSISDGSLGDPKTTSVKSLMTAARRRRIVETLHGYGRPKPGDKAFGRIGVSDDTKFNRHLMKELQAMAAVAAKQSGDGSGGGMDAAAEALLAEKGERPVVGVLAAEQIERHERDMDARMRSETMKVTAAPRRLPTLVPQPRRTRARQGPLLKQTV